MFSIIIPLYNKETTVYKSVESILAQSLNVWELIIVNDGSTDKSAEVINGYLADSRIRLINKTNGGVSSARNEGIKHATGDWILFLDADDYMLPDALRVFFEAIARDNPQVVIANFLMSINGNTEPYSPNKKTQLLKNYLCDWIKGDLCPRCGATLFHKSVLIGFEFDEQLSRSEDTKFSLDVLHGLKIKYVSEPVMIYNQENLCLSQNYNYNKDFISTLQLNNYSFWERVFLSNIVHQGIKHYPQKIKDIKKRNPFFMFYYLLNNCIYYTSRIYIKLFT